MNAEVTRWLATFEHALASADARALESLFTPEAYWRDLVALTWRVRTVSGAPRVAQELARASPMFCSGSTSSRLRSAR